MIREPATLIILAGGESKRMGFPKHRLVVDGRRVIDTLHGQLSPLFVETLVVGRGIEDIPPGVRRVEDCYDIRAALVGIHAGLTASTTDLTFVLACDMPYVVPALVEYLLDQAEGVDVVVSVVRGYDEPLCAVYRRRCVPWIVTMLEDEDLKVSRLFSRVRRRTVSEPDLRPFDPRFLSFRNVNRVQRSHPVSPIA